MKIKNLLLFAAAASISVSAFADDLATGEWGFLPEQSGGGPALIGQPTTDHLFVRNPYTDMGEEAIYDNTVSFKGGTPQTVWFWLDDSVMAADWQSLGLDPVSADEEGEIMYNEITYNSLECLLYLPEGFETTNGKNRMNMNAKFDWGDRMPFASSLSSKKQEVKVIDGINYTPYKIVIKNDNGYGSHFSANDEFAYEENGALGRDDAALFALFIKNNNQEVAQAHMPDMIIANLEFGFRESAIANWEPNKCRYFYGTGGNNETQRFQLYHRVRLYGSTDVVENLSQKTVNNVKYYNVAGMESNVPFEGVNIQVTTYNDGTTSTCKVIK